jgi:hypothetical protein
MRRLGLIAAALVVAAAAGCGAATGPSGLAPARDEPQLRINMRVDRARAVLGSRFHIQDFGNAACAQYDVANGIGGLAAYGRITVVSLSPSFDAAGRLIDPGPATNRGLRPGDGTRRAIALYGRPAVMAPEEYGGVDLFWPLSKVDGRRVWLRVTKGDVGSSYMHIQIGTAPSIYNVEGCA